MIKKVGLKPPFKGCHKCGQMGHWQHDCKKKINQHIQEVEVATCRLQKDSQVKQDFHLRQTKTQSFAEKKAYSTGNMWSISNTWNTTQSTGSTKAGAQAV